VGLVLFVNIVVHIQLGFSQLGSTVICFCCVQHVLFRWQFIFKTLTASLLLPTATHSLSLSFFFLVGMFCNITIYFCLGTMLDNVILLKILYNIILLEAWRLKVIYDFLFNNLDTLNCVLLNLHWHFYKVYRTCVNNARELKLTLSLSLFFFFFYNRGVPTFGETNPL
jgi:hypothetical protein